MINFILDIFQFLEYSKKFVCLYSKIDFILKTLYLKLSSESFNKNFGNEKFYCLCSYLSLSFFGGNMTFLSHAPLLIWLHFASENETGHALTMTWWYKYKKKKKEAVLAIKEVSKNECNHRQDKCIECNRNSLRVIRLFCKMHSFEKEIFGGRREIMLTNFSLKMIIMIYFQSLHILEALYIENVKKKKNYIIHLL